MSLTVSILIVVSWIIIIIGELWSISNTLYKVEKSLNRLNSQIYGFQERYWRDKETNHE